MVVRTQSGASVVVQSILDKPAPIEAGLREISRVWLSGNQTALERSAGSQGFSGRSRIGDRQEPCQLFQKHLPCRLVSQEHVVAAGERHKPCIWNLGGK